MAARSREGLGVRSEWAASLQAAWVCLRGAREQLDRATPDTLGLAAWHHVELRAFGRQASWRARRLLSRGRRPAARSDMLSPDAAPEAEAMDEAEAELEQLERRAGEVFGRDLPALVEVGLRQAGHVFVHRALVALAEAKPLEPLLLSSDDVFTLRGAWLVRVGMRLAGEELRRGRDGAGMERLEALGAELARRDEEVRRLLAGPPDLAPGVPTQATRLQALTEGWGRVFGLAEARAPLLGRGGDPWVDDTERARRGAFLL